MNLLQSITVTAPPNPIQLPQISTSALHTQLNYYYYFNPFPNASASIKLHSERNRKCRCLAEINRNGRTISTDLVTQIKELEEEEEGKGIEEDEEDNDTRVIDCEEDEVEDEFSPWARFKEQAGEQEEMDYDKNPEFAEILGACLDEPAKAKAKMEERVRKKRDKILHTKTGSGKPMTVTFNKFDFSNSYIWFEFYNSLLEKDVKLLCDTLRSWHIIGRLGGCNSMNMQLSQSPMDKRPSYDAIVGANITPATFYNIGDLEIQDNLARIWVDIGTSEPLLLDILVNALTQISSDYVGIKQVVFGGSEFENWREDLKSEDAGYSAHKI